MSPRCGVTHGSPWSSLNMAGFSAPCTLTSKPSLHVTTPPKPSRVLSLTSWESLSLLSCLHSYCTLSPPCYSPLCNSFSIFQSPQDSWFSGQRLKCGFHICGTKSVTDVCGLGKCLGMMQCSGKWPVWCEWWAEPSSECVKSGRGKVRKALPKGLRFLHFLI